MTDMSRRRSERTELFASLQGEATVRHPIEITDISPRGMRIASGVSLNLNCQYEFRMTIGDRAVAAMGRVVHTGPSPDQGGGAFLAGIEFIDLSESSQAIINDFIKLMSLAELKLGIREKPATKAVGQDKATIPSPADRKSG